MVCSYNHLLFVNKIKLYLPLVVLYDQLVLPIFWLFNLVTVKIVRISKNGNMCGWYGSRYE